MRDPSLKKGERVVEEEGAAPTIISVERIVYESDGAVRRRENVDDVVPRREARRPRRHEEAAAAHDYHHDDDDGHHDHRHHHDAGADDERAGLAVEPLASVWVPRYVQTVATNLRSSRGWR